jgi:hypothetical protein
MIIVYPVNNARTIELIRDVSRMSIIVLPPPREPCGSCGPGISTIPNYLKISYWPMGAL